MALRCTWKVNPQQKTLPNSFFATKNISPVVGKGLNPCRKSMHTENSRPHADPADAQPRPAVNQGCKLSPGSGATQPLGSGRAPCSPPLQPRSPSLVPDSEGLWRVPGTEPGLCRNRTDLIPRNKVRSFKFEP